MPSPSKLTVSLQDIDASTTTRTSNGSIHRDRICGADDAKRKLELEWSYPDSASVSTILQAFKDVFFYVKYYDPYENAMRTAQFYTGDRSVPMYSYDVDAGVVTWESLKFNIIEK